MKRVAYYITGHGYGHTTRSVEVIRQILNQDPDTAVSVVTDAPQWLFGDVLEKVNFYPRPCDVGAVQSSSFNVDVPGTLDAVSRFYDEFPVRISQEAAFLADNRIDGVVADIPALAFLAADAAHVPAIAIGNFSWDWIYQPYLVQQPGFEPVISMTRDAYKKATLLLRLPFHGDMSVFPSIRDIPLIAGQAVNSPAAIRRRLGVKEDDTVILVMLRQADLDQIDTTPLASLTSYRFIFPNRVPPAPNFVHIQRDAYYAPDLINACDLVVTKPGYSILAECAAAGTPMLYGQREQFHESEVLVDAMETAGIGRLLPRDRLISGDWGAAIQDRLAGPPGFEIPDTHGAAVAAAEILSQSRQH